MTCPKCSTKLLMSDRQGVEIDYCPSCRGVWLDRGELDKVIERSASFEAAPQAPDPNQRDRYQEPSRRRDDDDDDDYKRRGDDYRHKRKKGFLGEIFDF